MNRKKRKAAGQRPVRCPYCGSTVELRSADGIYQDNRRDTWLYVCRNYPQCDAYVRVHAGTDIPVGTMADRKLRALRTEAHRYFDRLYKSGYMSKQEAYGWLAGIISAPLSQRTLGTWGSITARWSSTKAKSCWSGNGYGIRHTAYGTGKEVRPHAAERGAAKKSGRKYGVGGEGHKGPGAWPWQAGNDKL